jgi:hypothetical protein
MHARDYVYLLGLYLGDGHIAAHPRGVWRLRIFQDARYVDLIETGAQAMSTVSGTRVGRVKKVGCIEISSYWKHWVHVFPQHGPGMKYKRTIRLERWQEEAVAAYPKEFLAGLIQSDGCRSLNTIKHKGPTGVVRVYSYARYQFSNASDDIRLLFTNTCDVLGVTWTRMTERNVAISRRTDVEFLDTFIGPKS